MTFDDAFERLIGHEGGYSNNPKDPGGETMYGVTKRVAVASGYTGDMKALSLPRAKFIAKTEYWDPAGCNFFAFPIAYQLFDIAYNSGVLTAKKMLQRAVGAADDGKIGPATIKAVAAIPVTGVVCLINAERIDLYASLGTWPTFGKGWARRVAANLRYGVLDK